MKKRVAIVLGLLLVFGVVSYAVAGSGQRNFRALGLTGYEENPDLSTPGTGNFRASLNSNQSISYTLTYGSLEAPVLQSHIHFGKRAINAGISAFLCTNLENGPAGTPTCPPNGGTVQGVIDPSEVVGPAGQGIAPGEMGELIAAMRAGHTYVNVHTEKYPGGEIRQQIR